MREKWETVKPCPFCGSVPANDPRHNILCYQPIPPTFAYCCANPACCAFGPIVPDIALAIAAWNRRGKPKDAQS